MLKNADMRVELYYASIPGLVGFFAAHYWFVVHTESMCNRYEVWQKPNVGGCSIGHVHRNLKPPQANVGGGRTILEATWHNEAALPIIQVLQKAQKYPFCNKYRYWPGPNSNTFVAWVLRESSNDHHLGRMPLGKRYPVPK